MSSGPWITGTLQRLVSRCKPWKYWLFSSCGCLELLLLGNPHHIEIFFSDSESPGRSPDGYRGGEDNDEHH